MKTVIALLLMCSVACAEEWPNWIQEQREELRMEREAAERDHEAEGTRIQEYHHGVPVYGDYYEYEGKGKWQRHEDYVPVLGDYFKEER